MFCGGLFTVEFTTYRQGVFQSPYNSITQEGENWAWEKVDHAVVVVGWGWAKHGDFWLPYWKIRNSWGPTWGENGYARILRGVNEMAIERVAVAADVLLYQEETAVFPKPFKQTAEDSGDVRVEAFKEPGGLSAEYEDGEVLAVVMDESSDAASDTRYINGMPEADDLIRRPELRGTSAGAVYGITGANLRSINSH